MISTKPNVIVDKENKYACKSLI